MLSSNNIIWSKGPLRNDYSRKATGKNSSEAEIIKMIENAKELLYIRSSSDDLDIFSNHLNKLTSPIILITADGTRPVPSSFSKTTVDNILNHNKIIKWYTQNYDKSIIHEKLKHYPIGMDLHTTVWLINNDIQKKIDFMIECRKKSPTDKRIKYKIFSDTHHSYTTDKRIKYKIFSNTHHSYTHDERKVVYSIIKQNKTFDLSSGRKSFIEITKDYNKYNFVLSPRGRGVDCHRTWELFLAGAIVITRTSTLDEMLINNNLPVIILNEWDELNEISEEVLNKWYNDNIHKTSMENIFPKLMYTYWIQ